MTITNQTRQGQNLPQASFRLIEEKQERGSQFEQRIVQVKYEADFHDGRGLRDGTVRLGQVMSGGSTWSLSVSGSNAPKPFFDQEAVTIQAIVASAGQNGQVMAQEQQGVLNQIAATGAASRAAGAAIDSRREASAAAYDSHMKAIDQNAAAFDAHMDGIDRQSKMTQDYILDRSVVHDNDYMDVGGKETGTVSNGYADSLVKGNPDRFQIVPNQDMVRGRDY